MRGFTMRMRFTGKPTSGATMRRGAQHQALVLVEPADRDVGLNCRVLLLLHVEFLLEDPHSRGERGVHSGVAHRLTLYVMADVAGSGVNADGVPLVVNNGRAFSHGLALVEYRGEDLIGHLYPPARLLRDLERLGGDRSHPIAHVTDLVVETHLIPRVRVGPALATRGVLDSSRIAMVQDCMDAGERPGGRVVDVHDTGVGVGASEHLCVEHAAQLHVVGERRIALHQFQSIHLGLGRADDSCRGHVG
jgi:hypothetical protein